MSSQINVNIVTQIVCAKLASGEKTWTRNKDLVSQSIAIAQEIEDQVRENGSADALETIKTLVES